MFDKCVYDVIDKYLKDIIKEMSTDQKNIKKRRACGSHSRIDDRNFAMLSIKLTYLYHLREFYRLCSQRKLKPYTKLAHNPYIPNTRISIDSCDNTEIRKFVKQIKRKIKLVFENSFEECKGKA